MEIEKTYKLCDKVYFEYWDNDLCKDVSGIGWIREFDNPNNQAIVSTTRGIKWMEPEAIKCKIFK